MTIVRSSGPRTIERQTVAAATTRALREKITKQKLRAEDGFLTIPDAPGLGIDLDDAGVDQFRVS